VAVDYSAAVIDDRLTAVRDAIDAPGGNASLILYAAGTVISTISLVRPCGTVNGGVLTFLGTLLDPSAANTGIVDEGRIYDSDGANILTGLTVGIPPSTGYDILLSNGLNSTVITAGQTVQVLSAQITGS
jgi:hypothetical protein